MATAGPPPAASDDGSGRSSGSGSSALPVELPRYAAATGRQLAGRRSSQNREAKQLNEWAKLKQNEPQSLHSLRSPSDKGYSNQRLAPSLSPVNPTPSRRGCSPAFIPGRLSAFIRTCSSARLALSGEFIICACGKCALTVEIHHGGGLIFLIGQTAHVYTQTIFATFALNLTNARRSTLNARCSPVASWQLPVARNALQIQIHIQIQIQCWLAMISWQIFRCTLCEFIWHRKIIELY